MRGGSPLKEGDAPITIKHSSKKKEHLNFLGPALERMQKELSNLIQVQIQQQFQQQMQLQQQIHLPLEKGTPQMMHNWLSVANPSLTNQQMQTLVNQKVPPNIKSVAPNHNSMVKSQRLSNIFLVNIQGINPKVK